MTGQPLLFTTGFTPAEIGHLVNRDSVVQHVGEAAFLWQVRDRAVAEPHYTLTDLAMIDARVEAHVAGVCAGGDFGWEAAMAALDNVGPGEVFALAALAFRTGDRARMSHALHVGCLSDETARGLISALGWNDYATVSPWIDRLLGAKSAPHRAVGIAAAAIHRQNASHAVSTAVSDPDAGLRARALRAAGELKLTDLRPQLYRSLSDESEPCRFWAAWALALLGDRSGPSALSRWFERAGPFQMPALQLALRAMPLDESRGWISVLIRGPELSRAAVVAAGIVGDPTAVPWLLRRMDSPLLARAAGESFSMITGADLAYLDLDADPAEEGIAETTALDDESNLPWPSPERVAGWWRSNGGRFREGTRYLAGTPLTTAAAGAVLKTGKQRQRAAAAIEVALLHADQPLFEVRARGDWQQRRLAAWVP